MRKTLRPAGVKAPKLTIRAQALSLELEGDDPRELGHAAQTILSAVLDNWVYAIGAQMIPGEIASFVSKPLDPKLVPAAPKLAKKRVR